MQNEIVVFIGLALYFIALIALGLMVAKNESRDDYMIADRKISPFWSGTSIVATWFDGPFLFTFIMLGFASFYGVIWVCAGAILGLVFYIFAAPKIRKITYETNAYSYPELANIMFDKKTGLLISGLTFIVFQGLVVLMLVVGAQLLEALGNIPYTVSVILMAIISAIYLILGGFKASILTDLFQMLLLAILCLALIVFAEKPETLNFPPLTDLWVELKSGIWASLIFVLAIMFSSDGFSRIIATRSPQSARSASYIAIVLFAAIGIFFGLWGVAVASLNLGIEPDAAPIYLFTQMIPEWLYPFVLVALFGVLMSSIDTYAVVAAQSLINDGLNKSGLLKPDKQHPRRLLRAGLLIVFAIGVTASFSINSIIESFFVVIMLLGCGSPVLMAILTERRQSNAVFISVALSLITHIGFLIFGYLTEMNSAILNLGAIVLWFMLSNPKAHAKQ